MKKLLSIFLSLLLLTTLFCSCEEPASAPDTSSVTASAQTVSDAPADSSVSSASVSSAKSKNQSNSKTASSKTSSNNNSSNSGKTDFSKLKFAGKPYIVLNNNKPLFDTKEITAKSFEKYGALDKLGRCTVCVASVGKDIMPTEKRGDIGMIKPTGWQTVKYDNVDGKYLYNRCHLIGFQLTGENANKCNLITGTRYMNVDGMLPFENMVADYVKETKNHCMYRVTPIFIGNELVARGVTMEAYSVEDKGEGICFYVYCFNNQPDIEINYATGISKLVSSKATSSKTTSTKATSSKKTTSTKATSSKTASTKTTSQKKEYVLNTNTKKFHLPSCSSVAEIKAKNKQVVQKTRDEIIKMGYSACGRCHP